MFFLETAFFTGTLNRLLYYVTADATASESAPCGPITPTLCSLSFFSSHSFSLNAKVTSESNQKATLHYYIVLFAYSLLVDITCPCYLLLQLVKLIKLCSKLRAKFKGHLGASSIVRAVTASWAIGLPSLWCLPLSMCVFVALDRYCQLSLISDIN